MYHKWSIENCPLQSYASALIFSPTSSIIRVLFKEEEPKGINIKPAMQERWSSCLQTLKGHSRNVRSVAFSHDSTWLASASDDQTVKIWDARSGECVQTLKGHSSIVRSVAFSHDSTWLASASGDQTAKIWDASSGECVQTLKGHSSAVRSVAFSHDSTWLASASYDQTVNIWDTSSGECVETITVRKALSSISFDITNSYLHTNIGTISLPGPRALSSYIEPQSPQYQGLALSADNTWIKHGSKNLIWLPSEYRPSCSAVSGNTVGIGVGSGRVWICKVELDTS
jgi:WD40 repeat protein